MDDLLIGRRFGSYVIEQKLGEGGMGAVYRAVQPEIGKAVAIKFLAPQFAQNPGVVQRFFAEARAVNLIDHDNIVDIFDFAQQDGQSYFVMELLRGDSLEAVLRVQGGGFLAPARALDIAVQVAETVAAAHARNIIHRDLKPDNIFLLTRAGRADFVKLLDFGIAKLTDGGGAQTVAGVVMGTPGYMSPEQGTGQPVDARTDIYALGVILFRMISGRLPFAGATFAEILQKQLVEPPPNLRTLVPTVTPSLATLLHRLIAREPADRPASMAEVAAALSAERPRMAGSKAAIPLPGPAFGSETITGAVGERIAASMALGEPPLRRLGRGTPLGLLGGAAALLVTSLGALWWFGRPPLPTQPSPSVAPARGVTKSDEAAKGSSARAQAAPAASAPSGDTGPFEVLVETDPGSAQVLLGSRLLGTTPVKVSLTGAQSTLRLRLAGFRDETLEVSRETEHSFVRLRPAPKREMVEPPAAALPKPPSKRPSIGLDD